MTARLTPSICLCLMALAFLTSCKHTETREMLCTGYCGCGDCNGYTRGRWLFLKLDFWNRYITYGEHRGEKYTGRTAGGGKLRSPEPGLFSLDTLKHPWMIPVRILLPWKILPRDGTIAADRDYYEFGTRMYVPGWGWGVVDDVGGAIQGPDRLDLFFRWHFQANRWGRRHVQVEIEQE